MQGVRAALAATIALFAAACDGEPDGKPYVEFVGGGFIFNYNISEAYYGFVARVVRRIPAGTMIEVEFENPSGGAPFIERRSADSGRGEFMFRTPPVEGVRAGRDYRVELRLIDPAGGTVIARYTKTFRSSADQDILPIRPVRVERKRGD